MKLESNRTEYRADENLPLVNTNYTDSRNSYYFIQLLPFPHETLHCSFLWMVNTAYYPCSTESANGVLYLLFSGALNSSFFHPNSFLIYKRRQFLFWCILGWWWWSYNMSERTLKINTQICLQLVSIWLIINVPWLVYFLVFNFRLRFLPS
jgi:hypothetical protein